MCLCSVSFVLGPSALVDDDNYDNNVLCLFLV